MKRVLLIFGLVISAFIGLQAQGVTSIELQPVCWNFNNVDSSLTAYWLMSSRETAPRVVSYLNPANGAVVDISGGGTVSAGYCCCSNSGSGGTTVTVTDNSNGTYTIIAGSDTTLIDTRADSNPVAINIAVGDTIFLAGSTVQEIINQIATEVNTTRSRTGCDLKVFQAAHGFDEGDLLAQDSTTGEYYLSSSDTTLNWPVAYVCQVVSADTFFVDTEGWLTGAHGFTPYRDYYNNDTPGSVGLTPGTIQQFAFRTFTDQLRYYDIPEYAVDGVGAGGSGDNWGSQVIVSDGTLSGDGTVGSPLTVVSSPSPTTTASNGLNDQDVSSNVDVELGGTIDKNTTISIPSNYLSMAGNSTLLRVLPDRIRVVPNTANEATRALGAALRKDTAPGSDANVTYTPYGIPYFAPLTSTSHYSIYYEADKSTKWVYHPPEGNGMFWDSELNVGGGSVERTLLYGLGGPIYQPTNLYFDTSYLNFTKDPTVLDTTYQFQLLVDPTSTYPLLNYTSRVYDSGNSRWDNAYYTFTKDSLEIKLNNSVGTTASNESKFTFSRTGGLKISFLNSLTRYVEMNNTDGITLTYGGSAIQIDTAGNILYSGVPNYANDGAADADGTLPSGSVYTVTAENRSIRIKP